MFSLKNCFLWKPVPLNSFHLKLFNFYIILEDENLMVFITSVVFFLCAAFLKLGCNVLFDWIPGIYDRFLNGFAHKLCISAVHSVSFVLKKYST